MLGYLEIISERTNLIFSIALKTRKPYPPRQKQRELKPCKQQRREQRYGEPFQVQQEAGTVLGVCLR